MKQSFFLFWVLLFMFPIVGNLAYAQSESECLTYLNDYQSKMKHGNYASALDSWKKAFVICPIRIGHQFYQDGCTLYYREAVIQRRKGNKDIGIIDTLMLLNATRGYLYPEYKEDVEERASYFSLFFSSGDNILKKHFLSLNEEEAIKEFISKRGLITRVAIINPRAVSNNQLSLIENALIKGEICKEISRSRYYEAFTRTDVDHLLEEHNFQNSGIVSEEQRHSLGQMSGVDCICSINVTRENGTIVIEAFLINIKTGKIISSSSSYCEYSSIKDAFALEITCKKIAQELTGSSSYKRIKLIPSKNETPRKGKPYTETAFGIDMPMVYIKGGVYGEGTDHEMYIEPFYISTFLVTQEQWTNVMGSTQEELFQKSEYYDKGNSDGARYPVYCVSPQDATDFCRALSSMTGLLYDLPTDLEWEMAANKQNEDFRYSGSDEFSKVGWGGKSMPVGLKKANSYGIYDMTGNVAEICKYENLFALKGGVPWGNYDVNTIFRLKGFGETSSSPYVGFRVVMRCSSIK